MKFKAPEGATSVNIGGEEFTVKNGYLTTPDGDYASLLSVHGYVVCHDNDDKKKGAVQVDESGMLTGVVETKMPPADKAPAKFQMPVAMSPVIKGKK